MNEGTNGKIEEGKKKLLKSFPDFEKLATENKTNIKINHHMASTPGFEPEAHWWKASAFITPPTFLPLY